MQLPGHSTIFQTRPFRNIINIMLNSIFLKKGHLGPSFDYLPGACDSNFRFISPALVKSPNLV
jgi:hypothetical protein